MDISSLCGRGTATSPPTMSDTTTKTQKSAARGVGGLRPLTTLSTAVDRWRHGAAGPGQKASGQALRQTASNGRITSELSYAIQRYSRTSHRPLDTSPPPQGRGRRTREGCGRRMLVSDWGHPSEAIPGLRMIVSDWGPPSGAILGLRLGDSCLPPLSTAVECRQTIPLRDIRRRVASRNLTPSYPSRARTRLGAIRF